MSMTDPTYQQHLNREAGEYAQKHQYDGAEYGVDLNGMDLVAAFFAGAKFREEWEKERKNAVNNTKKG